MPGLLLTAPPDAPSDLTADVIGNVVSLSWSLNSRFENEVIVYRAPDEAGPFEDVLRMGRGELEAAIGDHPVGTWYYAVVAVYDVHQSDFSNVEEVVVAETTPAPVAAFSAGVTTAVEGSTIPFTDSSTGVITDHENYVDDVLVSTTGNFTHQFSTAGVFTVRKRVIGPGGFDDEEKLNYITILAPIAPQFVSCTVNGTGDRVTVRYDVTVTGHQGHRFSVGGVSVGLSYLSGEGTVDLVYEPDDPIYQGQVCGISYLTDEGNIVHATTEVQAYAGFPVNNQSAVPQGDVTAPTIESVSVNDEGNEVEVAMSEVVTGAIGFDDFSVELSGGSTHLTYSSGLGTATLLFGPSRTILDGETGTMEYGGGGVVDLSGNPLLFATGIEVNNGSDATAAAPGQPTGLQAIASDDTNVSIGWFLADDNDTSVILQRSLTGAEVWTTIATLAGGTVSYTDRAVFHSTGYDYRVAAANVTGTSSFSDTASATTAAGGGTVSVSGFSVTKNSAWQITVAWTMPASLGSTGANDAVIERCTDGVNFEAVWVFPGFANASFTWADSPLTPGTQYTYRLRIVGHSGHSDWTTPASATTDAIPGGYSDAPRNLRAVVVSSAQANLTWDADPLATYEIETAGVPSSQLAAGASFTEVFETAAGASSYALPLTAKTPVYVRVRANRSGNRSAYEYIRSPKDNQYIIPIQPASAGTAQTYEIGVGKTYASWAAFVASYGSGDIGPGSSIKVYAPITLAEKILVHFRGTSSSRITIEGVPDDDGNLPVIEAQNAVTPSGQNPGNTFVFTDLSIVLYHRRNTGTFHTPGFVTLKNFEIRHSGASAGTYTAYDGSTRSYSGFPSIYIAGGDDLEFENLVVHGIGNGIFAADNGTVSRQSHNITIKDCHFYNNGDVGSFLKHHVYVEAQDVTVEGCLFGTVRAGSFGGQLKDRGTGIISRYNKFEAGTTLSIGFVEHQNSRYTSWMATREKRRVRNYGNIIVNNGTATQAMRFGGDQGFAQGYRKGDLDYYHCTLVERFNSASRVVLCQAYDAARALNYINNIRLVDDVGGSTPGNVLHATNASLKAFARFGVNCFSPNILDVWTGGFNGLNIGLDENVIQTYTPGFIDVEAGNYRPLGGTTSAGRGSRLPDDYLPVDKEFAEPRGTIARTTWGTGSDLGALKAGPDETPPTVTSSTIDAFGGTLAVRTSELVTTDGSGFGITATNGAAALTYVEGSGTDELTFTIGRPILTPETVTLQASAGACEDLAGNPLAAIAAGVVVNGSEETSATGEGVRAVTTYDSVTGVTTATYTKPSGVINGDTLWVALYVSVPPGSPTASPASGAWTTLELGAADYQADGYSDGRLFIFYHIVTDADSEPATYDFTISTAKPCGGFIARVALMDTAALVNGTPTKAAGSLTLTTQTSPSVTTNVNGCYIMRFWATGRSNFTVTVPPGHVSKANVPLTFLYGGRCGLAVTSQALAGATGTADFTANRTMAFITVALKPAV